MKKLLGEFLNGALGIAGFELKRRVGDAGSRSLRGALGHLRSLGFEPATAIDVGVATGTQAIYETFPEATHLLVEPLEEYAPDLRRIAERYSDVRTVFAAATAEKGDVTIHVHPDLFGSSMYLERDEANVNGEPRVVPGRTLDALCDEERLEGPYLLKLDVQGAELDVLAGASRVLSHCEYVVLEAVLYDYFEGGRDPHEVLATMKAHGFALYDVLDPLYRPLDGALSQIDFAFVRENGPFRKHHVFASPEQRQRQNERLARSIRHRS